MGIFYSTVFEQSEGLLCSSLVAKMGWRQFKKLCFSFCLGILITVTFKIGLFKIGL